MSNGNQTVLMIARGGFCLAVNKRMREELHKVLSNLARSQSRPCAEQEVGLETSWGPFWPELSQDLLGAGGLLLGNGEHPKLVSQWKEQVSEMWLLKEARAISSCALNVDVCHVPWHLITSVHADWEIAQNLPRLWFETPILILANCWCSNIRPADVCWCWVWLEGPPQPYRLWGGCVVEPALCWAPGWCSW